MGKGEREWLGENEGGMERTVSKSEEELIWGFERSCRERVRVPDTKPRQNS